MNEKSIDKEASILKTLKTAARDTKKAFQKTERLDAENKYKVPINEAYQVAELIGNAMGGGFESLVCNTLIKGENTTMYKGIKIQKTNGDGGFIIEVGCKTFVAKTEKELFKALSEYWADPEKAEKKHVKVRDKAEYYPNVLS
jgi:hypothetical protein